MGTSFRYLNIVGATGNVGREVIQLLNDSFGDLSRFFQSVQLLASHRSVGLPLVVWNEPRTVRSLEEFEFGSSDWSLFTTDEVVSSKFVPQSLNQGGYTIDSSSFFRLKPDVPLVVGPVNSHLINSSIHLYATANCLASPLSVVLNPLHRECKVQSIGIVTLQSVSGAGQKSLEELQQETHHLCLNQPFERQFFDRPIGFNLIPQVGGIQPDGWTTEEQKIRLEVQKILNLSVPVTVTATRVPVKVGHSMAVWIDLEREWDVETIQTILKRAPGIQLSPNNYMTPSEIVGSHDVWVGRLRKDLDYPNRIHLWLCSDNLRRGAALDALEILCGFVQII